MFYLFLLKKGYCIVWHFLWDYSSRYGIENDDYILATNIFGAICDGALSLILMYIANGYGIITMNFFYSKWVIIEMWCVFIVLVISDVLSNVNNTVLMLLVVAYVLVLRRILKGN